MKIKEDKKLGFYFQTLNKLKQTRVLFGLGVIIVYSVLLILLGGIAHKEGVFGEVLIPAVRQNIKIPFNYMKGIMSDPEHLIIDIKHKDYQKLAFKRKNALREGVLHPLPEDYVNAKIRWDGRTTKVKLRIKGDLSDHWARDYKWSLRVKAKGNGTILGMKNFSLQHPRTRGFFNDWFLHEILKKEGLIALRYDFVDVVVNGKKLGIYALEEHFEQKLLENNQRVDGPIIRIKDHLLWYLVDPKTGFTANEIDELYTVSPIDAFTTTRINNNKDLLENFKTAKNLLEAFRRGKLKTSEVFDADKLAKLFAVIDLFGYQHTTAYSNIRFYFNPFTSRLEPVGYDNTFINELKYIEGQGKKIKVDNKVNKQRLQWKDTFFEDRLFFEKYMVAVKEVSNRKYLDNLFDETAGKFDSVLNKVYKTFPAYSFDEQKNMLYKNQQLIEQILNPLEAVQAYVKKIDKVNNKLTLEVGNNQFLPVLIKNVSINGRIYQMPESKEVLLQAKTPYKEMLFSEIQLTLPKDISWLDGPANDIKVNYSLLGSSEIKIIKAFPWSYLDANFLEDDVIRKKTNIEEFDFIKIAEVEKKIYIQSGSWKVNKNLIIPEGYTVVCGPNTEFDILGSSFILSRSPLKFIGGDDEPVVIRSSDQTGQGILVLNTTETSVFKNVIFENISNPVQSGLQVKGALTFYESDVEISNVKFTENRSDIDLYVVRSKFNIDRSTFEKSKSIALNAIYSEGSISNSTFKNNGHTALEITGSIVDLTGVEIAAAGVNGLNVNDGSELKVKNMIISDTWNAVVSNNSSMVDVQNISIKNCTNVFSALQTKSDYGPSSITVAGLEDGNISGLYLIENKSTLLLGDESYETYTQDVFEKLRKH